MNNQVPCQYNNWETSDESDSSWVQNQSTCKSHGWQGTSCHMMFWAVGMNL